MPGTTESSVDAARERDVSIRAAVAASCLTATLMPLNSTMIAVAVPRIGQDLHLAGGSVTQAVVVSYLIAAIALQSAGGKLGDRIGHWRVFRYGQLAIGAGAVMGFLAPNLTLLSASRVVMAAGGALVVPTTMAVLRSELPAHRHGRAFGSFGAVMSLAAGIGPIIGGQLVSAFGWRSVFVVNLPVLAVSAAVAATARRREPAARRAQPAAFDWQGAALLTTAVALVVTGLEARQPIAVIALLGCGAVVLVPFVLVERRVSDPVVMFSLFRSRPFTAGTSVIALTNLVMYALLFEIPLLTARVFGLGSAATGRLLLFMMGAMVVTSAVAGRFVDSFGPRVVAALGTLISIAGLAVLLVQHPTSAIALALPLAMLGAGIGLANPAAQSASLGAVSAARSGMAAGVGSSMRYLGGIAGVAILGRTLDLGGSRAQVLATHRVVAALFLGLLGLCLACAAALPRRPAG